MTRYEEIMKELETTTTMQGLQFAASGVTVAQEFGSITAKEARCLRQTIGAKMCEIEFKANGWTTLQEDLKAH